MQFGALCRPAGADLRPSIQAKCRYGAHILLWITSLAVCRPDCQGHRMLTASKGTDRWGYRWPFLELRCKPANFVASGQCVAKPSEGVTSADGVAAEAPGASIWERSGRSRIPHRPARLGLAATADGGRERRAIQPLAATPAARGFSFLCPFKARWQGGVSPGSTVTTSPAPSRCPAEALRPSRR